MKTEIRVKIVLLAAGQLSKCRNIYIFLLLSKVLLLSKAHFAEAYGAISMASYHFSCVADSGLNKK